MSEHASWSYRPGSWIGVFGAETTLFLPHSAKERAGDVWAPIDDGAGFDVVLDALLQRGLGSLTGFVLISGQSPAKVLVRGAGVRVSITADGQTEELDGTAAGTWVERSFADLTGVSVVVEDDAADDGGADLPTLGGLVRVSRADHPAVLAAPASSDTPEPSAAPAAVVAVPVDLPGESVDEPVDAPEESVPAPGIEEIAPVVAAADEPPVEETVDQDDADPVDPVDQQTQALDMAEIEAAAEPAPEAEAAPSPSWADAPPPPPPSTPPMSSLPPPPGFPPPPPPPAPGWPQATPSTPATPGTPDDADQPADVPPPPPPSWDAPPAPAGSWPAPGDDPLTGPAPESGLEPSPLDSESDTADVEMSSPPPPPPPFGAAPSEWAPDGAYPPPPPPPAAPEPPSADHDGLTMAGASTSDFAPPPPPGIPGQPMAPAVTSPVAKLVISSGETVEVDRVVLIGRAPEARRFSTTDQPRLVTVPSALHEISSTHIEVRPGSGADHGSAVVTDMGSTNGTVLEQPGLDAEDLKPGIAVQLIPGAVINLGDGVTISVARP